MANDLMKSKLEKLIVDILSDGTTHAFDQCWKNGKPTGTRSSYSFSYKEGFVLDCRGVKHSVIEEVKKLTNNPKVKIAFVEHSDIDLKEKTRKVVIEYTEE